MPDPITKVYDYLDKCNRDEVATYQFSASKRRFNPSSIANCSRQLYYEMTGEVPRIIPGFISLYGQDGDISHDSVRWLMKQAGVVMDWLEFDETTGRIEEKGYFRKEIEHNGERFTVSGRADGLVYLEDLDKSLPLEIKSVDGFKAKYIQSAYEKGNLLDYLHTGNSGKYYKWLCQMTLTSKMMGYDATYLVLKDRSLCQIGVRDVVNDVREGFIVPVDEALYVELLNKMAVISKMIREKTPPIREYLDGDYDCRICNFNHICRPAGDSKE